MEKQTRLVFLEVGRVELPLASGSRPRVALREPPQRRG